MARWAVIIADVVGVRKVAKLDGSNRKCATFVAASIWRATFN